MTADAFLDVTRSLNGARWEARQVDRTDVDAIIRQGLDPMAARLLAGRGVAPGEAQAALNPKLRDQMPDPLVLADMGRAVAAVLDAVQAGQKIVILADYDVDGGTSGATLLTWLQAFGADAGVFVPDRLKDGYGPSPAIVRRIKEAGAGLLITVDCGAAAYDALNEAHAIGLDVVVFDHHLMHDTPPPARAVVNPNRLDDTSGLGHLTAAGVTFLAAVALNREARARGMVPSADAAATGFDLMGLLDLTALGTICDVAPLTGLNRVFVAQGLKVLAKLARPGLAALSQVGEVKRPGTVNAAGWAFGPRLNAGGRIGDSSVAVRLLATDDPHLARQLAGELDLLNQERRAIEQDVADAAGAMIAAGEAGDPAGPFLLVGRPGWHPGVIGIVAGRLKERFHRPVVVLGSADPDDPVAKGSGRSINGVNLGAAVAAAVKAGVIDAGGGHAMAAGLTTRFDVMDQVRAFLGAAVAEDAAVAVAGRSLVFDGLVGLGGVSLELLDLLDQVAPYGPGWPEPLFAASPVRPIFSKEVGTGHLQTVLVDDTDTRLRTIAFRAIGTPLGDALQGRAPLHVALKLKRSDWSGGNGVDVEVIDAAPAV
jgi:single-stranded-DNA-specific exonuclease